MRIGPDYSRKTLDWSRIAKISDLFNTTIHTTFDAYIRIEHEQIRTIPT